MSKIRIVAILFAAVLMSAVAITANAQMRNPTDQEAQHARQTGPCSDPWVSIALTYRKLGNYMTGSSTSYINGIGDLGECNRAMYNGGSWSSFNELYQGVQTALGNLGSAGASISATRTGNRISIVTDLGGGFRAVQIANIISNDGASIISNDGASIVASGAGNFSGMATTEGNTKRVKLGKSVIVVTKR